MASNFTAPVLDTISHKCFPVPAHSFLPRHFCLDESGCSRELELRRDGRLLLRL